MRRRAVWALITAYALLVSIIAVAHWDATLPQLPILMGTRDQEIAKSIQVLDDGGPVLLGPTDIPIGVTDDQGAYLYLPLLSRVTSLDEPRELLRWSFIGMFAIAVFGLPLLAFAFFRSIAAAVVAPWPIVFSDYVLDTDIYWISAWVLVLCLPGLAVVARRWPGIGWGAAALAGLCVVASLATSIRSQTGLPVLLGAFIVTLLRVSRWRWRVVVALTCVFAYLTVYPVGFEIVRDARDRAVGDPGLGERYPARHPFWHNAYIGLGYLENRYGIRWEDSISTRYVATVDPRASYLGPRYEQILRDRYFDILRHDPGLVVRNILAKSAELIRVTWTSLGWILIFGLLYLSRTCRVETREAWLVAVPSLILTPLPALLTLPIVSYGMGFITTVAYVALIGLLWLVARMPAFATYAIGGLRRRRTATRLVASLDARSAFVAGIIVAVLAIGLVASRPLVARLDEHRLTWDGLPLEAQTVTDWTSPDWIRDWTVEPGTRVTVRDDGVDVRAMPQHDTPQLLSPPVALPSGAYIARVRGVVADGDLALSVLDGTKEQPIARAVVRRGHVDQEIGASFRLAESGEVRLALANPAPGRRRSRWELVSARVVLVP
jgi:hypothetical protein